MCGIVGLMTNEIMLGKSLETRNKFFEQALIMDTLRGKDSTGMFGSTIEQSVGDQLGWLKSTDDGFNFVRDNEYSGYVNSKTPYKFLVGHNRAATVGSVVADNAHPFQEGPITMVHNGSLWTTETLPQSMRALGVEVDSHAICHNLAKYDAEEIIPLIDGAFTLVWHDNRDDSLNIVRNSQRPLHLAKVKGEETLLFMSEAAMLYAVSSRIRGLEIEDIVYPKVGHYMKFSAWDILNPVVKEVDLDENYYTNYRTYSPASTNRATQRDWGAANRVDPVGEPPFDPKPRKVVAPSEDNRIQIGGSKGPIPTGAELTLAGLKGLDISPSDRLEMMPVIWKGVEGTTKSITSGYGMREGISMILYGMSSEAYSQHHFKTWTVRPIAVKYLHDGEPALVVKLVLPYWESPSSPPQSEKPSTADGTRFRGPGGEYVTGTEYDMLTMDGCLWCGQHIHRCDDQDIVWVKENTRAVCWHCSDDYRLSVEAYESNKEKDDENENCTVQCSKSECSSDS